MTIKPIAGQAVPPVATKKADRSAEPSDSRGFAGLLDAVQRQDAGRQAAAVARLAQLQMVRGLVDYDEDGPGLLDGMASPLPLLSGLYGNSQQIDTPLVPQPGSGALPGPVNSAEDPDKAAPFSVAGIIERAAGRYGVDPALVKAVVRAESSFDPEAVSPVGAEGLMQLMPGTARDLGVTDSLDPEQNVMGGTRYLRQMLDKYDGDLDRALAAYNWGPGNVDRKGIDVLPRETSDYLVKVKRFYEEYQG
ncbi:lytic transglycosylase [Desulfuromonas versatilis]|uniref:Lytic transglycosylase n=1 Tax=Desulfuromonas versatilis TaxID=2802975 RepID=A0ABN6E2T7_9BACT|nr:lytic transglycosylase domain-containing protein [Desulfuromonas versatilis]BCR06681.1 lytic transglycosylase [Desulfuromonas versatilis]